MCIRILLLFFSLSLSVLSLFVEHQRDDDVTTIKTTWTALWIVTAKTGLGRSKFLPKPLPQEINMLLSECDIGCYPDASEKSPSTASITTTADAKTDTLPTAVGCVDGRNANNLDTSLDDDDDDDNRIGWVRFVLLSMCVCVWMNERVLIFRFEEHSTSIDLSSRQSIEIEANKQISEHIIPFWNVRLSNINANGIAARQHSPFLHRKKSITLLLKVQCEASETTEIVASTFKIQFKSKKALK